MLLIICCGGVARSEACTFTLSYMTSQTKQLTTLWHHALLHFSHLRLAHGTVYRGHLDHALTSSHTQTAGDAAGVPLAPLSHHTAAGRWT